MNMTNNNPLWLMMAHRVGNLKNGLLTALLTIGMAKWGIKCATQQGR